MDTEALLRTLERAIAEKEKTRQNYQQYVEGMNNKTLRKLVQGVLQREQGHLEFLHSMRDSITHQGDMQTAISLAEGLLANGSSNEQQLELLKMMLEGTGAEAVMTEQPEVRREELVQDFIPEPMIGLETPVRRQTGSGFRNVRNVRQQNRSVVSCQLNNSRSVSRKSR